MAITTMIDTTAVPCNLVITNTKPLIDLTTITHANDLREAKQANLANSVDLPIYPNDGVLTLPPQTEIIVRAETSREYLFWFTTTRGCGLQLDEQEAPGGGG